jgi:hypothetical protein
LKVALETKIIMPAIAKAFHISQPMIYNKMKIKLWSIQDVDKIDEIKSTGHLICLKNLFSKEWDDEYKWMIKQMEKRIGKIKFVLIYD